MSETEDKEFEVEDAPEGATPPPVTQDAELDAYTKGVQDRINAMTAETSRLKREVAEAREFGAKAADVAKRAVTEVEALRKRNAASEDGMIESLVSSIESDLLIAQAEVEAAFEAQDGKRLAAATAKVSATAADLRRAQVARAGHKADLVRAAAETPPVQREPNPPPRQTPQVAPRAQTWLAANSTWFGKDAEKTRVARAADTFVAQMGYDPNSDEYYKEVDKVIASRLNGATPGGQQLDQRSPASAVAPAGRSTPAAPSARKVSLSPSEQATAKRIGVTPEDYAKAKLLGGII